jgi:2-oxoglutarate ferredoxin oxidoreductase subunit beta
VSLALGAEATFVARTLDTDRKHLTSVLRAAAQHHGTALVEIYQNCNIFNDGAFEPLKSASTAGDYLIPLEHGKPIRWGSQQQYGLVRDGNGVLKIVDPSDAGDTALLTHDAHSDDPSLAFDLSRLPDIVTLAQTPIGVFRDVHRATYDQLLAEQVAKARGGDQPADLAELLTGPDPWTIN